jgi:large subunit ribosomal protein L5
MADTAYVPRLREQFDKEIRGKLTEQFGYANVMQVPRLDKVVLNMGIGEAVNDRKKAETAAADLALIAGQKPIVTFSRVAIATFKLRENQPIGAKVTLRKAKMYEFIDRLINVARAEPEELRRPRQLFARHQGTHHFPRDRLRQDGGNVGYGCHGMHHGADRRRS